MTAANREWKIGDRIEDEHGNVHEVFAMLDNLLYYWVGESIKTAYASSATWIPPESHMRELKAKFRAEGMLRPTKIEARPTDPAGRVEGNGSRRRRNNSYLR